MPRPGDHSDRLAGLAGQLCTSGFAVIALDHQGNGRSEGDRLHCERYQKYVDDVEQFVDLEVTNHITFTKIHDWKLSASCCCYTEGGLVRGDVSNATCTACSASFCSLSRHANSAPSRPCLRARLLIYAHLRCCRSRGTQAFPSYLASSSDTQ